MTDDERSETEAPLENKPMSDDILEQIEKNEAKERTHRGYEPDDRLQRADAALALTAAGFPTSYDTLSLLATKRTGPPYYKFGRNTYYRYADLMAWAEARMQWRVG
jgi:hypothetical protein